MEQRKVVVGRLGNSRGKCRRAKDKFEVSHIAAAEQGKVPIVFVKLTTPCWHRVHDGFRMLR